MQKRMNKKGFTITELVIVIVVIAILAAVLIPTFVSLTKKANLSADQQAVRQMNTVLVSEKKAVTIDAATKILADAGYNADKSLVPVTKYHSFYWYETYNIVVLVNEDNGGFELVYPTNDKNVVDNVVADKEAGKLYNLKLARSKADVNATNVADVLSAGGNAVVSEDISFSDSAVEAFTSNGRSANVGMAVPAGETVSIDLGGKSISTESNTAYALGVAGEVHISNGTITSRGIYVFPGGKLVLDDSVVVEATGANGGSAIRNYGGVVIINGGTYTVKNAQEVDDADRNYQPGALYCDGGYVEINGGTFSGNTKAALINVNNATLVINDCTVNASRLALSVVNCVAEINGGTFKNNYEDSYAIYACCSGVTNVLKISGGTFENESATGHDACIIVDDPTIQVEISDKVLVKGNDNFYESVD